MNKKIFFILLLSGFILILFLVINNNSLTGVINNNSLTGVINNNSLTGVINNNSLTGVINNNSLTGVINNSELIKKNLLQKDFDIRKYDKDGLTQDIFNECREYIGKTKNKNYDVGFFWNNEFKEYLKYNIDFTKKIDCNKGNNNLFCIELNKTKDKDKYILQDIVIMLYGIYTDNFTYELYLQNINNIDKIKSLPNLGPDLAYSKYFGLLISGKINNTDDCINYLYDGKGNIQ